MMINAELRRNIWLELSPLRLALAPLVIAALLYVIGENINQAYDLAAYYLFMAVGVIWGTRRAAVAVFDEVSMGTWDNQRMSSLGSWTLALGKLLGATVYPWYCALLLLGVLVYRPGLPMMIEASPVLVAKLVLWALTAQASALAASLMLVRRGVGRAKRSVTAAQMSGLIIASAVYWTLIRPLETFGEAFIIDRWYDIPINVNFAVGTLAVCCIWAVLWAERQMRIELQYRTWPWVLPSFMLFIVAYVSGFLVSELMDPDTVYLVAAAAATLVGLAFTYLTIFLEPKDKAQLRAYVRSLSRGHWRPIVEGTPIWLVALLFFLIGVLFLTLHPLRHWIEILTQLGVADQFKLREIGERINPTLIAVVLFVLRDMLLVLALSFGRRPGRADLLAVVLLGLNYFVLPALVGLSFPGETLIYQFFLPFPNANPLEVIAPVFATLVPVAALAAYQWRRSQRALR